MFTDEINVGVLIRRRAPFDRPNIFTIFGSETNRISAVIRNINQNAKEAA